MKGEVQEEPRNQSLGIWAVEEAVKLNKFSTSKQSSCGPQDWLTVSSSISPFLFG